MDRIQKDREPQDWKPQRTSSTGRVEGGDSWWTQIETGWAHMRNRVREQWDRLTDTDVDEIDGSRERLERQIRDRYGVTPGEASRQVEEWGRTLRTA